MQTFLSKLIFLSVYLIVSSQDMCYPGGVREFSFTNLTLRWGPAENPNNCSIVYYLIEYKSTDTGKNGEFTVDIDVSEFEFSTIDLCQYYWFGVTAVANGSWWGPTAARLLYVPYSSLDESDLSLTPIQVAVNETETILSWNLSNPILNSCISYYNITYWIGDDDVYQDIVSLPSYKIIASEPCENYTFSVTATIDANAQYIEGPNEEVQFEGYSITPAAPKVAELKTTQTEVHFIWSLESYSDNPCTLYTFNIITPDAPANVSNLVIPIAGDSDKRPEELEVTISGLSPGTRYTSYASLLNEAGNSPNSTIVFHTAE